SASPILLLKSMLPSAFLIKFISPSANLVYHARLQIMLKARFGQAGWSLLRSSGALAAINGSGLLHNRLLGRRGLTRAGFLSLICHTAGYSCSFHTTLSPHPQIR